MKLFKKFNTLLLTIGIFSAFFVPIFIATPTQVLAAGCPTSVSSDSQVTNQQNCINRHQQDCKRKGFDATFCEGLRVADINQCAADKANTLKKACLEKMSKQTSDTKDNSSIGAAGGDCEQGLQGDCGIVDIIVLITNVLAGLAATVIVAMIIVGGIQYSMAGAEAAKVQAAKQKITNALLALMLLLFGFSIIQWLIPGGLI